MDIETKEMLQMILSGMEGMEERLTGRMDKLTGRMDKMDTRFTKLEIIIENDVCKRIDALFDGYKLNHEKQWELEKKVDGLEHRLEQVEAKQPA